MAKELLGNYYWCPVYKQKFKVLSCDFRTSKYHLKSITNGLNIHRKHDDIIKNFLQVKSDDNTSPDPGGIVDKLAETHRKQWETIEEKCECGAERVYGSGVDGTWHSDYCPKFKKPETSEEPIW